jgi:glycosyltransferase involved in cell wall biosynthesis
MGRFALKGGVEPRVSVIVPCLNAEATLARCLDALADQAKPPFEVIVADNGSRDRSLEIVARRMRERSLPLRLVRVARRGAAAARNAAAEEARGDWLAFTDSDCVPEPAWLASGMALIEGRDAEALAGPAWGAWEGDAAARLLGLTSLAVPGGERVMNDAGPTGTNGAPAANLWVRRDVFAALGGFDESLSVAGEDFDFCARLFAAGHRMLYSPRLRVMHLHASGIGNMCRKTASYGRAHALLLERHGKPGVHLDLPLAGRLSAPAPVRFWCNLASADKKALFLLAISLFQPWLAVLLPAYVAWLGRFLRRRARSLGHELSLPESFWMGALLILKSAAMTWGRCAGSRRRVWTC